VKQIRTTEERGIQAITALESAAVSSTAAPSLQIRAAILFGQVLTDNPCRDLSTLKRAVQLLPTLNTRSITRQDQQANISEFFGLASSAASSSIESGENRYEALITAFGTRQRHDGQPPT